MEPHTKQVSGWKASGTTNMNLIVCFTLGMSSQLPTICYSAPATQTDQHSILEHTYIKGSCYVGFVPLYLQVHQQDLTLC